MAEITKENLEILSDIEYNENDSAWLLAKKRNVSEKDIESKLELLKEKELIEFMFGEEDEGTEEHNFIFNIKLTDKGKELLGKNK